MRGSFARRWASNRPARRIGVRSVAAVAAVVSLLPLGLLAYFSIRIADAAVASEVEHELSGTAAASGVFVAERMQALADLANSYVQRPQLVEALGNGDPAHYDGRRIMLHVVELRGSRPGIATAFLADPRGRLVSIDPHTPAIVGVDFSYRDWYPGVIRTVRPYVSEAYQSAAARRPRVVAAAAVHARQPDGRRGAMIGIIVVAYDVDTVQHFTDDFALRRVSG